MCSFDPTRHFLLTASRLDDNKIFSKKNDIKIRGVEHFETYEHFGLGKIKLEKPKLLTLGNGIKIKFEEIIALAGDFYGLPNQPIIDPAFNDVDQEDSGKHQRFRDAYNTLARTPKNKLQNELDKLLATLQKEIKAGAAVAVSTWDEITGGVWFAGVPVKLGRMMQLAETNYDHFLPHAKYAYLAGHQLAIDKAREAGNHSEDDKDEQKRLLLHEAFSLEAFSCHFLTDSFASGHIRTPRVELGKATWAGKVGSLLCRYMHDEDNKFGLRVRNKRGDKWIAYGDGMLLKEENGSNLKIALEAVQKSSDQVHEAYKNPSHALDPAVVTDLIPFVDQEERNNSPLFQVKDGKLRRREDVNNLQDRETVTNWWGITTAAKLLTYKPKNSAI